MKRVETAIPFWCERNWDGYVGPMPTLLTWEESDLLVVTMRFVTATEVGTGEPHPSWVVPRNLLRDGGQAGPVCVDRVPRSRRGRLILGWPGRKQITLLAPADALDLFLDNTYAAAADEVPEAAIDALIAALLAPRKPQPDGGT